MGSRLLEKLRTLFDTPSIPQQEDPHAAERRVRLATAALLVEVARADFDVDQREDAAIHDVLQSAFGLDEGDVATLVEEAQAEVDSSIALHPFTQLINTHFSAEEKERVIELMWHVVYADGVKDALEEHIVRRVADLLYVPHAAFIRARQKAQPGN